MKAPESSSESSSGVTEIEFARESLRRSDILHVIKEVLGYILETHQMIPTVLQRLEQQFYGLKNQYEQLELLHKFQLERNERKASRRTNTRKIELKKSIKKLETLMNSISTLLSALQVAVDGVPDFHGVTLLLGGSLSHPFHVYEIFFSHVKMDLGSVSDKSKSKAAEALSKKVVRALMSNNSATPSLSGPTKLFLLIKCPGTFRSPLHFLPKRDFRYNKKVLPIKLHVKCKIGDQAMTDLQNNPDKTNLSTAADKAVNEMLWFLCRQIVRGVAFKSEETNFLSQM